MGNKSSVWKKVFWIIHGSIEVTGYCINFFYKHTDTILITVNTSKKNFYKGTRLCYRNWCLRKINYSFKIFSITSYALIHVASL
jgi:hypothetical protein